MTSTPETHAIVNASDFVHGYIPEFGLLSALKLCHILMSRSTDAACLYPTNFILTHSELDVVRISIYPWIGILMSWWPEEMSLLQNDDVLSYDRKEWRRLRIAEVEGVRDAHEVWDQFEDDFRNCLERLARRMKETRPEFHPIATVIGTVFEPARGTPVVADAIFQMKPKKGNHKFDRIATQNGLRLQPQHRSLCWGTGKHGPRRPVPEGVRLYGITQEEVEDLCASFSRPFPKIQNLEIVRVDDWEETPSIPPPVDYVEDFTSILDEAYCPVWRLGNWLSFAAITHRHNSFVMGMCNVTCFHVTRFCLIQRLEQEQDGLRASDAHDSVEALLTICDRMHRRFYSEDERLVDAAFPDGSRGHDRFLLTDHDGAQHEVHYMSGFALENGKNQVALFRKQNGLPEQTRDDYAAEEQRVEEAKRAAARMRVHREATRRPRHVGRAAASTNWRRQ